MIRARALDRKAFLIASAKPFVLTGRYLAELNHGIAVRIREKEAANATAEIKGRCRG